MRARRQIRISKEVLPALPEGYEETRLGDPRGARRQFRGTSGVHVREYEDEYLVHVDRVDPRSNPLGHLVMDSPETLISVAAGFFLLAARATKKSTPRERRRVRFPFSGGITIFLVFFFAMNDLARFLKKQNRVYFWDKLW